MKVSAVFLDRDGVIIKDVDNLRSINQIVLIPQVIEAIKLLNDAKIPVIVVTNQPVVARGLITEDNLEKIHETIKNMLQVKGAQVDGIYYCPHHPNANVQKYKQACKCRKPEPGMLLQGAKDFNVDIRDCCMIGDRNSDVLTGKKAGCMCTIRVSTGVNKPIVSGSISQSEITDAKPDYICKDLFEAVKIILNLRNDSSI